MKAPKANIVLARSTALRIIKNLNIRESPIDPLAIARDLDIVVKPSEKLGNAFSGCLMRHGEAFGILYSTSIPSLGFQRFTVSHELGHFHLKHQHQWIFEDDGCHWSQSNFSSYNWFEVEADHFAAEFLMPEPLFREALRGVGTGIPAIKRLSEIFETSLISTAIRFARCTYDPMAIVVSRGNRVEYCFASEALQRLRNVTWGLKKGDPLPPSSTTAYFNRDKNRVECADVEEGTSHIGEWFTECDVDITVNEDVMGLGRYGKTMTVIFTDVIPDDNDV